MIKFKQFILIFIIINNIIVSSGRISDLRLCADEKCSVPISNAYTLIQYQSPEKEILSFKKGAEVVVYSKSAGDRMDLWGVEIRGVRGYIPHSLLREKKILVDKLAHYVPTKSIDETIKASEQTVPSAENQIIKDGVENLKGDSSQISPDASMPYEVFDGTTVYSGAPTTEAENVQQQTEATPSVTLATPPITEASLPITEASLPVTEASPPATEATLPVTEATPPVTEATQPVTEATPPASQPATEATPSVIETPPPATEAILETTETILTESPQELKTEPIPSPSSDQIPSHEPQEIPNSDKNPDDKIETNPVSSEPVVEPTLSISPDPKIVYGKINAQLKQDAPETENVSTEKLDSKIDDPTEDDDSLLSKVANFFGETVSGSDEVKSDAKIVESSEIHGELNTVNEIPENNENVAVDIPVAPPSENINITEGDVTQSVGDADKKLDVEPTENVASQESVPNVPYSPLGLFHNKNEANDKNENESQTQVPNNDLPSEPVHFLSTTNSQSEEIPIPLTEAITENTPKEFTEQLSDNDSETSPDVPPQSEHETKDSIAEEVPLSEGSESGFFSRIYDSIFGSSEPDNSAEMVERSSDDLNSSPPVEQVTNSHLHENPVDKYLNPFLDTEKYSQSCNINEQSPECSASKTAESTLQDPYTELIEFEFPANIYTILICMSITAVTILMFCLGHYYIEKHRQDGALISSINSLEKKLLVMSKENCMLQDELTATKDRLSSIEDSSFGSNEMVSALKSELEQANVTRSELEEQISGLERELESATEAGMELNRMLTEMLSSQSGNENVMLQIENLQKQLIEQQGTINGMKTTLNNKNTETELLQTELSVATDKIGQLQSELDQMVINLLSVQEEKAKSEFDFEAHIKKISEQHDEALKTLNDELEVFREENKKLKTVIEETQRALQLKSNEYTLLEESMCDIQMVQSNKESLKALLDVSKIKAEILQLRDEKHASLQKLQSEKEAKLVFEKQVQVVMQEMKILKDKFEEAEKDKVEAQTRLEVLSTYFKDKEAQMQKAINEQESLWVQKQGEATSTIERIKWIQEEMQNYKSQNEVLKKEILDQEVSLKSQISMLEKKAHENWVLARQAERRVEETKQEASQLRNRLTIVEKNLNNSTQLDESKNMNRILSPLEANGDMSVSPLHMSNETPGSPPLLFPHRDGMTTSPALPGLPPFMPPPPPPGVPFLPPHMPHGVPPFMPPPPALFPGDHRPPPLGRMSSPPLHGRYSNDSRPYSPYDRDDSPPLSPMYSDSDYRRRTPPMYYPGPPPHRNKSRGHKGPGLSSGSGNSNESLDNSGRQSGRV